MGHFLLSKCSLSPEPQLTLIDLSDIFQTLRDLHKCPTGNTTNMHSFLFEARDFDATLEHKFKNSELPSGTQTTETGSSDSNAPFTSKESLDGRESIDCDNSDHEIDGREFESDQTDVDGDDEDEKNVDGSGSCAKTEEMKKGVREEDDQILAKRQNQLNNGDDKKPHAVPTVAVPTVAVPIVAVPTVAVPTNEIDDDLLNNVVIILEDESPERKKQNELQAPIPETSPVPNPSPDPVSPDHTSECTDLQVDVANLSQTPNTKRRRNVLDVLDPPTVKANWGIRAREAVLDWLSPDETPDPSNTEVGSGAVDITQPELEPSDPPAVVVRPEEAEIPYSSPSKIQAEVERDFWYNKNQESDSLMSTSNLIKDSVALLILMSGNLNFITFFFPLLFSLFLSEFRFSVCPNLFQFVPIFHQMEFPTFSHVVRLEKTHFCSRGLEIRPSR